MDSSVGGRMVGTYRAFDSARDVIYPHLIWEFVHSRDGKRRRRGEEKGTSDPFVPISTIPNDTRADFD